MEKHNIDDVFHLKNILKLSPGNVYWKSKDGRFLGCNQNVADILGLSSCDDIIGKKNRDLFSAKLAKQATEIDKQVMKSGKEYCVEENGLNIDWEPAIYLTRKLPLRNAKGDVIGILGISIDITEMREQEAELKVAREAANASQKAKNEFLANMSHDIKTPYHGIYGIADGLYQQETDPEKKEYLGYIVQSCRRLLELLNQITDIAKLGGISVSYKEFNILESVTEVTELMAAEAKRKGLILSTECPDAFITSDKFRVNRILTNLVGNALKFTDSGEVSIRVVTYPVLKIFVNDTGVGIPQDKHEFIFDQFAKLNPSHDFQTFTGAGLGLYMSKKLASEIGGDVMIEDSTVGKGSEFSFTLPAESFSP